VSSLACQRNSPSQRIDRSSITEYLSNNNVQMGASYEIGQKSSKLYSEGYEAGARYINADPEEIGQTCRLERTGWKVNIVI
jgi:hypothetical protein